MRTRQAQPKPVKRARKTITEVKQPVDRPRVEKPVVARSFTLEPPVDDGIYWYVGLLIADKDDYQLMEKRIREAKIPAEVSLAPSGCRCYRVNRKYKDRLVYVEPPLGVPDALPYGLPSGKKFVTKERAVMRLSRYNSMPYLYKEWTPLVHRARKFHNESPT